MAIPGLSLWAPKTPFSQLHPHPHSLTAPNNEMKASLRKSAVARLHICPHLTETIPESPVANTKSCVGDFLERSQEDQVMENSSQSMRGGP